MARNEGRIGTDPMWIDGETKIDRRRSERQLANLAANLKSAYATRLDVRVEDLSPEGCRVVVHDLCRGDRVFIQMGDFDPWLAEVRWSDGEEAGLLFVRPLDPTVAIHLSLSPPQSS